MHKTYNNKQKSLHCMCVFVCTCFLFSWKVLRCVMFQIKNGLFYCGLDWGTEWRQMTQSNTCDNRRASETWGNFFRLISKLWNVQRSRYSQHIHRMVKLWPWLLSFLPFLRPGWAGLTFLGEMSDRGFRAETVIVWVVMIFNFITRNKENVTSFVVLLDPMLLFQ